MYNFLIHLGYEPYCQFGSSYNTADVNMRNISLNGSTIKRGDHYDSHIYAPDIFE